MSKVHTPRVSLTAAGATAHLPIQPTATRVRDSDRIGIAIALTFVIVTLFATTLALAYNALIG